MGCGYGNTQQNDGQEDTTSLSSLADCASPPQGSSRQPLKSSLIMRRAPRRHRSPTISRHNRRRCRFATLAALSSTAAVGSVSTCAAASFLVPPPSVQRRLDDRATMIGSLLLPENGGACPYPFGPTNPRNPRVAFAFTSMAAGRRTATATEEDPYAVLGIPRGTTDAREIKRAYRRMAMRYHPDVAGDDVDPAEASERFVKINAAYELLSGKTAAQNGGTGPTSGTSSTTTGGGGYTPPHRRSGPYSSPNSGGGTYTTEDWRDYMPKDYYVRDDDEDEYNKDGDSFTAIFSDIVEGIAAATASGGQGGILTDLIEFLEGNFPEFVVEDGGGFGGSDADGLESILRSNDPDLIRDEMDDATLLVRQLETKLGTVERDIARLEVETSGGGGVGSFATRMEREEELEELRARRRVVEGYVKRARKRLLKLQTKVKEMHDARSSGGGGGGGSRSGRGTYASSSTRSGGGGVGGGGGGVDRDGGAGEKYRSGGSTDSRGARGNAGAGGATRDAASTGGGGTATGSGAERESFGSFGRGRGTGRSRSARGGAASGSTSSSTADAGRPGTYDQSSSSSTRSSETESSSRTRRPRPSASTSNVGASTSASDSLKSASSVPPHRRSSSPSWRQERDDKKRFRELQVDDEFDKLKKELGL